MYFDSFVIDWIQTKSQRLTYIKTSLSSNCISVSLISSSISSCETAGTNVLTNQRNVFNSVVYKPKIGNCKHDPHENYHENKPVRILLPVFLQEIEDFLE